MLSKRKVEKDSTSKPTYLIQNKNFQEIKNIFLFVVNKVVWASCCLHYNKVLKDRSVDWAFAALKVAKKEKKKKSQLKKFQSLVSLAKSDHIETLNSLLEQIKIKPIGGRKNKMQLLDAELKANGESLKLKHSLLEDIIEWKKIRKLCQEKVSWLKSNN